MNDLEHPGEQEAEDFVLNSSLELKKDAAKKAEQAIQKAYRAILNLPHLPLDVSSPMEGALLAMLLRLNDLRGVYLDAGEIVGILITKSPELDRVFDDDRASEADTTHQTEARRDEEEARIQGKEKAPAAWIDADEISEQNSTPPDYGEF